MYDGLLFIDKPVGWTSHDAVVKVRNILRKAQKAEQTRLSHIGAVQGNNEQRANRTKRYGERAAQADDAAMRHKPAGVASSAGQQGKAVRKIRVGHTGTLDPLASGLLVLVVGNYTKRASEFSKLDKTYEATMRLGETSSTGDEEGEKTKVSSHRPTREELEVATHAYSGEILQMPHAYSAVKIEGRRAYDIARKGKEVKLEPRAVTIHGIQLSDYGYPEVKFIAKVSSGTYIRTLAEDIGNKLGAGAYLTGLRRTMVGGFSIEQANPPTEVTLDKITQI